MHRYTAQSCHNPTVNFSVKPATSLSNETPSQLFLIVLTQPRFFKKLIVKHSFECTPSQVFSNPITT